MHGCSGGACVVAPGGVCMVAPGGHAWLLRGGMCGCSGGHVWLLWGGMHGCFGGDAWLLGGHAWLLQGGMRGCSRGGHAWDTMTHGDTVNERAVRILLECILVFIRISSRTKWELLRNQKFSFDSSKIFQMLSESA